MITIDHTVVVQILAFLLFWLVLSKILFRPLLALLEERERRTEGFKAEAASLKEEAERLKAEYEAGIARAAEEANAAKGVIVREAHEARERFLALAREEAARVIESARKEVELEMQRGRELAVRESEVIAQQMAEKILGRNVA